MQVFAVLNMVDQGYLKVNLHKSIYFCLPIETSAAVKMKAESEQIANIMTYTSFTSRFHSWVLSGDHFGRLSCIVQSTKMPLTQGSLGPNVY